MIRIGRGLLCATLAAPALGQTMDHGAVAGMAMPGMGRPAADQQSAGQSSQRHQAHHRPAKLPPTATRHGPAQPRAAQATVPSDAPLPDRALMPGMAHGPAPATARAMPPDKGGDTMPAMSREAMPGMGQDAMPDMGHSATERPTGDVAPVTGLGPPAPVPTDHAADAVWGAAAMQASRRDLRREHGGQAFGMVLFNLAEYQARRGRDGYRWDGEAWYGGDLDRLVVKTEGAGTIARGVDSAEVQLLYSRTIGPYWNLQGGIRHDVRPSPARTYGTLGLEGLAPNNFDVAAAAFLSTRGDLLARLEGWYDQRLTQRLILQPRAELNFAAQDVPADGYGAGLIDAELGLRLRYEVRREFAPYLGVSWQRDAGGTARYAHARGEGAGGASLVAGVRTWF